MSIRSRILKSVVVINLLTALLVIITPYAIPGLVISLFITMKWAGKIAQTIETDFHCVQKVVDELASGKGDLTLKVTLNKKSYFLPIADSLNRFMDELEQIIAKVNVTSRLVADSSVNLSANLNEILANSQNQNHLKALNDQMELISRHVNDQAAFSANAAEVADQLALMIDQVDLAAQRTSDMAQVTSQLARESEDSIKANLSALENIQERMGLIDQRTEALAESSKQIEFIVETINRISEKTSLLALNAAIEAARAGQAGSRFSVVSDEVGRLATSSAQATTEIDGVLQQIRSEIDMLLTVAKQSREAVTNGRETTEKTNRQILDIMSKVNETGNEIQTMAQAIAQQKSSVYEINGAVNEISQRSNQISDLAESQLVANSSISAILTETTANSGKLSEVADALKNVVSNFKVSENVVIKRRNAVEWSEDFSVRVALMDDEHKVLFDLINQLNAAMMDGKSSDKVGEVMDALIDYTRFHFSHEEELLKKCNYPRFSEQERAHRAFVAKVEEFKVALAQGDVLVSVKVIEFLKDWLIKHIVNLDTKYSGYLIESGVAA